MGDEADEDLDDPAEPDTERRPGMGDEADDDDLEDPAEQRTPSSAGTEAREEVLPRASARSRSPRRRSRSAEERLDAEVEELQQRHRAELAEVARRHALERAQLAER